MKKIFTLVAMAVLCLIVNRSSAQVSINFDNGLPNTGCWVTTGFVLDNNSGVNNSKAASTHGASTATLQTPYIDVPAGGTATFFYKANKNIQSGMTLKVSTIDQTETVLNVKTIAITSNTYGTAAYSYTFAAAGTYRLKIEYALTSGGAGNTYAFIDNLTIAGNYHYASGACNTAPVAANDQANLLKIESATIYVLNNDNDASVAEVKDVLAVKSVSQPAEGTVTINANNTLTFSPATSFTGGPVSFTYTITDNGYAPLTSTATVTLNYPMVSPTLLPVKLISFSGTMTNDRIILQWNVAENEIAAKFEVEKSTDGKNFTTAAVVMSSEKSGIEMYQMKEVKPATKVMYRLKMMDKDGVITYSKTISFAAATAATTGNLKITSATANRITATFTATATEDVQFSIYDMSGKLMQQQNVHLYNGQNTLSLSDNNSLRTGIYVATLKGATQIQTTKFFIQ